MISKFFIAVFADGTKVSRLVKCGKTLTTKTNQVGLNQLFELRLVSLMCSGVDFNANKSRLSVRRS
jgi:hypothetical protein